MENPSHPFTIIITSDEAWGDIWQIQLVYAHELSKQHRVIFVNPPTRWHIQKLFRPPKESSRAVKPGLTIFQYHNYFPVSIFNNFFTKINDRLNSWRLTELLKNKNEKIILWQFDLHRMRKMYNTRVSKKIYHVVENYKGLKTDSRFAREADLVLFTNPNLRIHYESLNRNILHIPHGINPEEHIADPEITRMLTGDFGNYILCLGSISDDYDLALLEKIALSISNRNLIFIGPLLMKIQENSRYFHKIIQMKNVKYLGTVHGLEIKHYVSAASVCLVPYRNKAMKGGINRSPLRILNYLAQKKVIVTSIFSEIPELENKAIYTASDTEQFIRLVEDAIGNKLMLDEKAVEKYLQEKSFRKMFQNIFVQLQ